MELLVLTGFIAIRLFYASPVRAQSPAAFEAASIKPAGGTGNARIIHVDPGMVSIRGMSLKDLASRAYGRGHALQLSRTELVSGGAKWCEDDLYDVDAKPGGNPLGSGEEVSAMLQALLVERFKLAFHHESKDVAGYVLAVGKDGPRLKVRHPGDGGEGRVLGRSKRGPHGEFYLELRDAPVSALASYFGNVFEGPVVDRTGLAGTFDIDLSWTPDETQFGGRFAGAAADSTLPGLFAALRDQLGLRLESGKVLVDVMVIDHAEKPSSN